jgi:hypothetical protein
MRAKEFIIERKVGKITKRQQQSTIGLNTFASGYDRIYDLNRVMMAVASTDGTIIPDLSSASWAGKNNTAHPYTQAEQDMLRIAYKTAGVDYKDLNHGDIKSRELDSINTQSTVKPFKGYKK